MKTTPTQRRDRLHELARLLRQLATTTHEASTGPEAETLVKKGHDVFWMGTFGLRYLSEDPDSECGTIACALGYASMHPPFQEQGLHMHWTRWDAVSQGVVRDQLSHGFVHYGDQDNAKTSLEAGMYFFGLNVIEAAQLFDPDPNMRTTLEARAILADALADMPPSPR